MDCVSEERQIREALASVPGLSALSFDLPARQLTISGSADSIDAAVLVLESAGFPAQPPQPVMAAASCCDAGSSCQAVPLQPVAAPTRQALPAGARFRIADMDCASEEAQIRRALEPVAGVRALSFQLAARTLVISAPPEVLGQAIDAIRQAGFDPQPLPSEAAPGAAEADGHSASSGLPRLIAALVLATAAELVALIFDESQVVQWLEMALAAGAIALSGLGVYKKGLASLLRGQLTINTLMSVAATGAFLIGQWPEAGMVMALYAIAELIEARSVDRARNAISSLMALAPDQAQVQQPDGSWAVRPVDQVEVGQQIRVRPGERLPLDGVVLRGSSAVNQAPVTGESIPVDKVAGDSVFAGTINETGELELRVTAGVSDTTLARIIHAVEQAQGKRAPTQRFVDRFAAIYTPAVFAAAVAVAVLSPWLLGWTWLDALYKALVLLVVGCPCALVISTPVTVVSALAAGARRGILIKGGTYLEQARNLRAVALDKTGTVTQGEPKLVHWSSLQDLEHDQAQEKTPDHARLAAALAQRSDHPVSRAIAQGLGPQPAAQVDDFEALAGRGVQGRVDGQRLALANHRLVQERGLGDAALERALDEHQRQGRTVTLLLNDQRVLAVFAVADTIRSHAKEAVADLKALGMKVVMLTGDNAATAQAIAAEAGIDDARGQLLPEDKLTAVQELQCAHGAVAMVGDGINDAPALAQADIGVAMGGAGTDTAMEAADVVVMNDDLRRLGDTIRLSRRTHAVLWQNISVALAIKAVFFVLTLAGITTMWMAVFADMGASLLVVGNGLRLLKGERQ
jgi:Cd2+/Zn2+-exporting ATPase